LQDHTQTADRQTHTQPDCSGEARILEQVGPAAGPEDWSRLLC